MLVTPIVRGNWAAAFTPSGFPGFVSDYDADLQTYQDTGFTTPAIINGATVKGWKDQNGNLHPVSATVGGVLNTGGPNGHNSIDFTKFTGGLQTGSFTFALPLTYYMVCQYVWDIGVVILAGFAGKPYVTVSNSSPNLRLSGGAGNTSDLSAPINTWCVLTAVIPSASGTANFRLNLGTRIANASLGFPDPGGWTIGNHNNLNGGATSKWARFLVYGAAHSTADQDSIVASLKSLYGIA